MMVGEAGVLGIDVDGNYTRNKTGLLSNSMVEASVVKGRDDLKLELASVISFSVGNGKGKAADGSGDDGGDGCVVELGKRKDVILAGKFEMMMKEAVEEGIV